MQKFNGQSTKRHSKGRLVLMNVTKTLKMAEKAITACSNVDMLVKCFATNSAPPEAASTAATAVPVVGSAAVVIIDASTPDAFVLRGGVVMVALDFRMHRYVRYNQN